VRDGLSLSLSFSLSKLKTVSPSLSLSLSLSERRALAPLSLASADVVMDALAQADVGVESVDARLRALFEQCSLGDPCAEVCKELQVESVVDLAYIKYQDLDDFLT